MSSDHPSLKITEPARECWCDARGYAACACDVPFIGSWAWADKRIAAGTLRSLDEADVSATIQADWETHAPRLMEPVESDDA
jgi:hypothetical protein